MELRILGPLEVVGEDGSLPLPQGRGRTLLAILALNPGRVVSIDRLIDQLWGATPPTTARTKLYGLISALRKTLEPNLGVGTESVVIQTRPPGYVLGMDPDQVDAFRFRRLIEAAEELPPKEKAPLLVEALKLWRGPALTEFTYEPFAQSEITALHELQLSAIEERIAAELDLGRHAVLVPELEQLVSEHPFRERLCAQAMLALYRSDNQHKALSVYRQAYRAFTDELGLEPSRALQELENAILTHDPHLSYEPETPVSVDGAQIIDDQSEDSWLIEGRRIVTVAYIDLRVARDAPDLETNRALSRRAHAAVTETLRRHGGTTQGSIGGVIVSVFGIPTAHEDDPMRAVRAGSEIIEQLEEMTRAGEDRPVARIGINTGEVVVGDAGLAGGLPEDAVRTAARLQQSAVSGEVLIGDRTRQAAGGAVRVEATARGIFDDAGRGVTAWRVVGTDQVLRHSSPRVDTPWVGRRDELNLLLDAFRATIHNLHPRRVTVVGVAGIGKSRLADEFADLVADDALVLTGHCPPYGEGITFWPLREIVQGAAGGTGREEIEQLLSAVGCTESIAEHVAGAIGSNDAPPRPDVLFPALRTFFNAVARDRPLVLVLEDIHWAQPTLIEFVEYLEDSVDASVMFLCLARPEFLDQDFIRPEWRDEILNLDPLDRTAVDQLLDFYVAEHGGSLARAQSATEVAEGNPLFIEQILAAFGDQNQPTIPPSIQALLVARLDQLGPAERDIIRSASVLGRQFGVDDLLSLIPRRARETALQHLESMEQKALIARVDNGAAFEFRHALIQLVSYQTLTKESRAILHAQVGELHDRSGLRDGAADEIIGYHFERAVEYRAELGIDDPQLLPLAARAADKLTRAGMRAFDRFDMPAAENLLTRGLALLPRHHLDWWTVVRRLAEIDQVMGRHAKAIAAFDGLVEEASAAGDERLEHFFRLERAWAQIAIGPDPISLERLEIEIDRGRDVFEKHSDDAGLAQVSRLMLHLHYRRGRMTEMEAAGRDELEHALKSGHPREVIGSQWLLAMAFEHGPRPVRECIEMCQEILHWQGTENPGVVSTLGHLWAMLGEFEKGRRMSATAQGILRERVRARRPNGQVIRRAGDIEILAGDLLGAERHLRKALELNHEMGETDMICQIAATLSRLMARNGASGEAERFATMSRESAPAQSATSQALWRSARALAMSLQGADDEARSLAQEARGMVPSEMLNLRAEVSRDLGEVLFRLGHRRLGIEAIGEAIELYEKKGNLVGTRQAASVVSALS